MINASPTFALRARRAARLLSGLLGLWAAAAWPAGFRTPEPITGSVPKHQLSRTPSSVMAFDASGRLHLVYWTGGLATSPATPSSILHRAYSPDGQWTDPVVVDDSFVEGVGRLGGRHPSLAITPDQEVWVLWHDHRHCTAGGNWIDNIELYGDRKTVGGAFSSEDIRFTTTAAAHAGDNAFTPKIVAHPTGRLSVAWSDFFFDPNVSEILLKTSDAAGDFDFAESMAAMRMTDKNARGGGPEFTVPDLAVDAAGTRHLVWAGGQGAGINLYYAEAVIGATSVSEQTLVPNGTDFFDPPRIAIGPAGDVWIAFGDDSAGGNENVKLLRRRFGETSFDAPISITSHAARQYGPGLAIAPDGRAHLAWVDARAGNHIYYGIYDPAASALVEEVQVTESAAPWARPAIALDAAGNVHLLFERDQSIGAGDVWFTTNAPIQGLNRAGVWLDYQ